MTDDITHNYHGGNPESLEANRRTSRNKDRDRAWIVKFLMERAAHGATCYEAEVELGLLHQTCSARFSDLKKDHVIAPNGQRRPTDTGSPAAVCVLLCHLPT